MAEEEDVAMKMMMKMMIRMKIEMESRKSSSSIIHLPILQSSSLLPLFRDDYVMMKKGKAEGRGCRDGNDDEDKDGITVELIVLHPSNLCILLRLSLYSLCLIFCS
jgi:hypothetical protein